MRHILWLTGALIYATPWVMPVTASPEVMVPSRYDIVVYGDSSGAVTAAVAARRLGHRVVLVNPPGFLGGMSSSGLRATDFLSRRNTSGGIAYRSIVPRQGECENLFSPVALSASHVGHGSIRMEPVFMVLSQSAAIAASIAIHDDLAVQEVPYDTLRRHLEANHQIVQWPLPVN